MPTPTPSRPFAAVALSIAALLLWLAASVSAVEPAERFLDGLRERELYDLAVDPGERRNLLSDPTPELVSTMAGLRRELEAWAASADPLQGAGYAAGCLQVHDQIDAADINPEFTRLFGFEKKDVVGKTIDPLLAPGEYRQEAQWLTKQTIKGNTIHKISKRKRKDGALKDV